MCLCGTASKKESRYRLIVHLPLSIIYCFTEVKHIRNASAARRIEQESYSGQQKELEIFMLQAD
jgi:hypothetical protein